MSAPDIFRAATQSILSLLGEDALFAGTHRTRINIERDVQFAGMDGDTAMYRGDLTLARDVATIDLSVSPAIDKTFFHVTQDGVKTGPTYRLDKYIDSNGYSARYVVLKLREP